MKYIKALNSHNFRLLGVCFVIFTLVACGPADPQPPATPLTVATTQATTNSEQPSTSDAGYPGTSTNSGYPSASTNSASGYPSGNGQQGQELLDAPPNPEVTIPQPQSGASAIGGVLVQEVVGQGFLPFNPFELILATIVLNSDGEPALIRFDEQSLRAETFPTGIFVFSNVAPGTYGLVVNTAVSQFAVQTPEGEDLMITVEEGQALDLGQVFIQAP